MGTFIEVYLKIMYILPKGTVISGNNKMAWPGLKMSTLS